MSTTGYGLEEQINDLNAELRDTRAQYAARDYELNECVRERDEARAQIAANWDEMGEANRKLQTELFEVWAQINEWQQLIKAQDELIRQLTASLLAHGTATWETKDGQHSLETREAR